jgi:hypothetical protein
VSAGGPPVGRSPWPVAAWAMTLFTVLALSVGIVGNVLSRTAVLDAIALWPLAALVIPALLMGLRGGRNRALAPLVLLSWLLVTVGLHLGGVEGLPSSAAAVRSDLAGITEARLTVAIADLSLSVRSGEFEVAPLPVGGSVGPPVLERVSGTTATALTLTDDTARSPWFRFGEYRITLPPAIEWNLRIAVSGMDLDLRDVNVVGGRFESATGHLVLGEPDSPTTVDVAGDIEVSVPRDIPVQVIGSTRVPDDWAVEDDGARSPTAGDGWTIRVVSGSVRIVSR